VIKRVHLGYEVVVCNHIAVFEEDDGVRLVAVDAIGAECVATLVTREHYFVREVARHLAE
jgi:hypothetical protein